MPRKFTQYICDICGKRYANEKAAINCENGHFTPIEIIKYSYDIQDDKTKYPLTVCIKVKDKNGIEKIIEYKRK